MKDTQIPAGSDQRIPFFSPALHCVAMTAIVFLRFSFGYRYLSPKSVFFAFSWAFTLFTIYAWNEPDVWREYRAACAFGSAAILLYWIHLLVAFIRECREQGRHDRYSGTPHAICLLRKDLPWRKVVMLELWAEPAAVLFAAAALRFLFNERHLSGWLVFVGVCLWCKEALNYWLGLRVFKAQKDMLDDAEGMADEQAAPATILAQEAPKATRKEPVKRKRNSVSAEETAREKRFLDLLRLREPYSLEKAEENYRTLIRLEHPDTGEDTPEANQRAADLNEAIEFVRKKLAN